MLQIPNSVFFETMGSYWWVNTDEKMYLRSTKGEIPREKPEWGNAKAGPLQDFVWHPYVEHSISECYLYPDHVDFSGFDDDTAPCCPHLRIVLPDGRAIFAPNVVLASPIRGI